MADGKTLDFYFDFMSPFAYLAHVRLPAIARQYGYRIEYHPIDLIRAKLEAGNTGPSNRMIPPKIAYLQQDLARWAALYGVPIKTPHTHDSMLANLGTFAAMEAGRTQDFVDAMWNHAWGHGRDFTLADISTVVGTLGLDPDRFLERLQSDDAAAWYEAGNVAAHRRGVFGVPTMIVGKDMWWGNDRLDFLERHLSGGKVR